MEEKIRTLIDLSRVYRAIQLTTPKWKKRKNKDRKLKNLVRECLQNESCFKVTKWTTALTPVK